MRDAVSRALNLPSSARASALLTLALTALAIVVATLVGELTYPLLAHVDAAQVRLAIVATTILVAAPVSYPVARMLTGLLEERRRQIGKRKVAEDALRESEEHFRHAVELSPLIPRIDDPAGNLLEISPRWFQMTGRPPEEGRGKGWVEALHPDDLKDTQDAWQHSLRTGEPYDVEHRIKIADGSYHWFRARASARKDAQGNVIRWYGTVEDIHARKQAEIALRESEAFANSILESTTDCIKVVDLEGRLQYMNPRGQLVMEIEDVAPLLGRDWSSLWPAEARPQLERALATARDGAVARFPGFCPTARGTPKWWDVCVSPIPGPDGRPARFLSTSRDISAIKAAQDELEQAKLAAEFAASHDSLTGLANRPQFRERLERQLGRTSQDSQTALLFLDLDEFKSVNDALGHPAGDELLWQAGQRLKRCLRQNDLVARFGGDEFAILQTRVKHLEQVEMLARRVISRLSEPYLLDGRQVVVGTSIGIAVAAAPGVEADSLLKRADIALYGAKSAGRGMFRIFEPEMEDVATEAQRLRSELRDALARGELRLHYQPVVELATSRLTGFEALLRWEHPRRGLVGPAEFIPLAEATGSIEPIGTWVLTQACAFAATWPESVSVSVNLSPRQFHSKGLTEAVRAALAASGLAARRLQLEVTESVLLQDTAEVQSVLDTLRALGVRLSIDDFGTGYSSLGYLRRFALDNIKIDKSFVADLQDNPRTLAILEAIALLGRRLGVSLTAEGIERKSQLHILRALGCDHGQGYLFSPPMPAEDVPAFVSRGPERERDGVRQRIGASKGDGPPSRIQ